MARGWGVFMYSETLTLTCEAFGRRNMEPGWTRTPRAMQLLGDAEEFTDHQEEEGPKEKPGCS